MEVLYEIPQAVSGQHFGVLRSGPFELEAGKHTPADEAERELLDYLVSVGAATVAPPAPRRPRKEA